MLPLEKSRDMSSVATLNKWLEEHPLSEEVALNRQKSKVLLPGRVGPESLSEDQQIILKSTGLTMTREGMRVVGVPVGTSDYQ